MLKKLCLTILCVFGMVLSAGAFGDWSPNAFDDAGKGSWEYKAVYTMCSEGKSPHYDISFFERDHVSRYELAEVMIDLLDNGKDLTEKNQQDLDKMKFSYEAELAAHGWHERQKKGQPAVEVSGDVRVRKTSGDDPDARMRVGMKIPIGSNTSVVGGGSVEK